MLTKKQLLHALITARAEYLVNGRAKKDFSSFIYSQAEQKAASLQKRGAEIVKCNARGWIRSIKENEAKEDVLYHVHLQSLIKQGTFFYIEEEIESRLAVFYKDTLITDQIVNPVGEKQTLEDVMEYESKEEVRSSYHYNRLAVVRYAETWWNSYNPKYKKFAVDCTNFISQCVHEGGAPMRGYPNKGKGWWMQNNSWSYSWAVAHAFHAYLKNSTTGLRAKQVSNPVLLMPGDVICYDFEGDGRWNHTTVVVAKDANDMPLVNAHTYNSRMRYWAYEDSSAYTPNIKYAFFRIVG
ncbi:amidase domain-containing protein [Bacillus songklensis]|uniref:amidase domain-containing protein n=1 Tax=Bacillus songklensis TaxID=1069116 RepID=UPI00366E8AEA